MTNKLLKFLSLIFILLLATVFFIFEAYDKKIDECKYKTSYPQHPSRIALGKIDLLNILDPTKLKVGEDEMAKHKLVIVGITRDNVTEFSSMVRHIEYIGSFFEDYRVILVENDSRDGTKTALESWSINNPKVKIVSKDFYNKKRPNHKFMANVRNDYINALEDEEYNGFDMVMMLDMDMGYGVDIRGVEDSFSKINQWDAVCSNGIRSTKDNKMYDVFAFRNEEFPLSPQEWQKTCYTQDISNQWTKTCKQGKAYSRGILKDWIAFRWTAQEKSKLYWTLIVPQAQKIYAANAPLVKVNSCFGGMAFYKREFIKDCRYDSIEDDCEHVTFHQCVRVNNDGRMMMNPSQMIRYD
jgi:hypothetical protein